MKPDWPYHFVARWFYRTRCVPCVSKVFVTRLPSLRGEMGCMDIYWRFVGIWVETDGAALCAVCFKSLRDEAPVASWGNGLYGYILATQRSRLTFWDRRRGTACRLFQKSLWRSSRRFVEKWVVWMYTGDAALKIHILKQTAWRCLPCVSKVFVTKLPSLRGDMGWNRRRGAVCRLFQKSSWRSSRRFVGKWVVWIYIGDAALKIDILRQAARHSVPSVSKVFVTKLSVLRGEMGCMDGFWWRSAQHAHFETEGVALCAMCFKSLRDEALGASWTRLLISHAVMALQKFWNWWPFDWFEVSPFVSNLRPLSARSRVTKRRMTTFET